MNKLQEQKLRMKIRQIIKEERTKLTESPDIKTIKSKINLKPEKLPNNYGDEYKVLRVRMNDIGMGYLYPTKAFLSKSSRFYKNKYAFAEFKDNTGSFMSKDLKNEKGFNKLDDAYQWIYDNYAEKFGINEANDNGAELEFKKGYGYWDLTKYGYGNDMKRFKGNETGTIIAGNVKLANELRVKLSDNRVIIVQVQGVTNYDSDTLYDMAAKAGVKVV